MARKLSATIAASTLLAAASALVLPSVAATNEPVKPGEFLTKEKPDQWRGSKLAGVNIYGSDQKKIGSINDVLVDHDGKAEYIVIGIGGFLGIGKKIVAVPFSAVTFTDQPINPPAPAPSPQPNAGAGGAPDTGAPMGQGAAAANPPPPPVAYPDHGVLNMTEDQLKNAPDFAYAE